jgi:hypothetical protein
VVDRPIVYRTTGGDFWIGQQVNCEAKQNLPYTRQQKRNGYASAPSGCADAGGSGGVEARSLSFASSSSSSEDDDEDDDESDEDVDSDDPSSEEEDGGCGDDPSPVGDENRVWELTGADVTAEGPPLPAAPPAASSASMESLQLSPAPPAPDPDPATPPPPPPAPDPTAALVRAPAGPEARAGPGARALVCASTSALVRLSVRRQASLSACCSRLAFRCSRRCRRCACRSLFASCCAWRAVQCVWCAACVACVACGVWRVWRVWQGGVGRGANSARTGGGACNKGESQGG